MVLGGALGPGFVACDAAGVCVAGVALGDIHLRFTWQLWHKLTSTVVLRESTEHYLRTRGDEEDADDANDDADDDEEEADAAVAPEISKGGQIQTLV